MQQSVSTPTEYALAEVSGQPWKRRQWQKNGVQHNWETKPSPRTSKKH